MKICKVHGYLKEADIKSGIYKGKPYRKCRQCENERAKKYAAKNKEKIHKKDKEYWEKNKEAITTRRQAPEKLAKRREWDKENRERLAPYYRDKQNRYKEELADPYIKKVIQNGNKNIRFTDISAPMIELQRAIITVKRQLIETRLLKRMGLSNENKKR